ncbi:MAG: hypothetical protein HQM14_06890 [SAR324 cluster bacterium]|nr:hypothetical protein [SAR324 cluster bacterium]
MGLIRSQSRFLMKALFKRDYNTLTTSSQNTIDKVMIGIDIAAVIVLFVLL